MAERRLHLLAVPLSLLGLAVGVLLILFDPVTIARQRPTGSLAIDGNLSSSVPIAIPIEFTDSEWQRVRSLSPLPPVPEDPTNSRAVDPRAARLGQLLFFDPDLSGPKTLSCATCHDPGRWFTDGRQIAQGVGAGTRNTPSLMNSAYQRWFAWDGRADSLWSQGLEPLERETEMAGNRVAVIRHVADTPALRRAYEAVFGPLPPLDGRRGSVIPDAAKPMPESPEHPLHVAWTAMSEGDRERINRAFANIGKAFGAYERELVDSSTPFDRFVAGLSPDGSMSSGPLSPEELRGLKLFVGKANCIQCHHGPNFSDNEFHNIGLPLPEGGLPRDPGRYAGVDALKRNEFRASSRFSDAPESDAGLLTDALVNSPENWGRFKTPSLRGVGNTAPFMHTGQFETLVDVVRFYSTLEGAVQLDHHAETVLEPLHLTEEEIHDLAAFLVTLRGLGPPEDLLIAPVTPSGALGAERTVGSGGLRTAGRP